MKISYAVVAVASLLAMSAGAVADRAPRPTAAHAFHFSNRLHLSRHTRRLRRFGALAVLWRRRRRRAALRSRSA